MSEHWSDDQQCWYKPGSIFIVHLLMWDPLRSNPSVVGMEWALSPFKTEGNQITKSLNQFSTKTGCFFFFL